MLRTWIKFIKEHRGSFDVICQRLIFSRQYDEEHELKNIGPRFKNKDKILKTVNKLLKPGGILILLDDRGFIFTVKQFNDNGFVKYLFEMPIMFTEKIWNVIVAYRKIKQ